MARIFLTGANGFIGRHLLKLLAIEHEIWALVRSLPEEPDPRVRWIVHDLAHELPVIDLPQEIDAIAHLAQARNYTDFPVGAGEMFAIAVNTTAQLLDWGVRAGAKRFVLASTGGVYGTSSDEVSENRAIPEPAGPLSFYFTTKLMAENLLAAYSEQITGTVLRYFFVYGAGQSSQMLMPRLLRSVHKGDPIYLNSEDGMRFNPTHVSDAAAGALVALLKCCPGTFNIAGPDVTNIRFVSECLGKKCNRDPVFEAQSSGVSNDLVADTRLAQEKLVAPKVGIDEGLTDLCQVREDGAP